MSSSTAPDRRHASRRRRRGQLLCECLLTCVLAALLVTDGRAVDLRDVLTDYTLTSWSRKDGLIGPVWAIDQDAAGFLWLGTDGGLVRFDGVRFTPWAAIGTPALPSLPVRSI